MRYKLILALVCMCTLHIHAQTYDCAILKKAIEHKVFKEHFNLCIDSTQALTLIDSSNYFGNQCSNLSICDRKLNLDNKWPEGLSMRRYSSKRSRSMFVLYKTSLTNTTYTLEFWHPLTNGIIIIEVKKLRKKFKTKVISAGVM